MREVRAAVGLRQRQEQVALGQVADQQHVEDTVIGLRLWRDHHPSAEVAAVRHDDVVHPRIA